jgi:hypothetical protein
MCFSKQETAVVVVRTLRMWETMSSLPCCNTKPALASEDTVPKPLHRRDRPPTTPPTGIDLFGRVELMYKEVELGMAV